ncbi:hypothetical protein GEV33_003348 [Tenebrio molitor]|uniref:Uncharacterized protein n=1 Tax=Tenebrio molitor TaxID=7067 RepID=A0A8J6LHV9_TENMO|nr:hypothetical protein GEV33_003348 [Tenebrio molitor]
MYYRLDPDPDGAEKVVFLPERLPRALLIYERRARNRDVPGPGPDRNDGDYENWDEVADKRIINQLVTWMIKKRARAALTAPDTVATVPQHSYGVKRPPLITDSSPINNDDSPNPHWMTNVRLFAKSYVEYPVIKGAARAGVFNHGCQTIYDGRSASIIFAKLTLHAQGHPKLNWNSSRNPKQHVRETGPAFFTSHINFVYKYLLGMVCQAVDSVFVPRLPGTHLDASRSARSESGSGVVEKPSSLLGLSERETISFVWGSRPRISARKSELHPRACVMGAGEMHRGPVNGSPRLGMCRETFGVEEQSAGLGVRCISETCTPPKKIARIVQGAPPRTGGEILQTNRERRGLGHVQQFDRFATGDHEKIAKDDTIDFYRVRMAQPPKRELRNRKLDAKS